MRHVVFEGLPAVGKSELLALLARAYPHQVRVLPELVKTLVLEQGIDLFRERDRLTQAIRSALPKRAEQVQSILEQGFICLEESHLGVHGAYAQALGDQGFLEVMDELQALAPTPDSYVHLRIPVSESMDRQSARGTVQFDIDEANLSSMLKALDRWHVDSPIPRLMVEADGPANEVVAACEKLLGLSYGAQSQALEDTFDVLLLLGRPASGKSEFIDFMTSIPSTRRASEFHIAPFDMCDDFPILWQLFQEEDVWEQVGRERQLSKKCNGNYAVADDAVWPFLIERINQKVEPLLASTALLERRTLLVEFSRGGDSGYADALSRLSPQLLQRAAALYISVTFEESWRRNVARYDEKNRGGLLTHSVPREEMERTYGTDDWFDLAGEGVGALSVNGIEVPFSTMPNEPESKDPDVLAGRYQKALAPLYERWRSS